MAVTFSLRIATVVLAVLQIAVAQQCYYPNGKTAPNSEKPCSSADGAACCPDTWECMDNGLCYNPTVNIYGRYSCTDKDWRSPGCPSSLCTDVQQIGAEAVTQCSNHGNQWCCDANRETVDCCQEKPDPRPFFALQDPRAYGTIGGSTGSSAPNLASITGKASGSGSKSPSSTAASTAASNSASVTKDSESSSDASSTAASTLTSLSTTVSTGTAGPTTIVKTVTQPAASTSTGDPSPPATPEKKNNIGLIVGCAVGIPLAIALIGILFWLFRKRAHQKAQNQPYNNSTDAFAPTPANPEFAGGANLHKNDAGATKFASTDPGVPELAGGQGIGPDRPVSMIPGKAEMDSGGSFAPGTVPLAPHLVGVGGGNGNGMGHLPQASWGSAPPGYSPAQNQGASWAPTGHADPMAGQYQAYRPGVNNVPEMAELPSVTTPPEVVELGDPSPPTVVGAREYPGMTETGAGSQRR